MINARANFYAAFENHPVLITQAWLWQQRTKRLPRFAPIQLPPGL